MKKIGFMTGKVSNGKKEITYLTFENTGKPVVTTVVTPIVRK